MRRSPRPSRPPVAPQIELPITLVALAAAVAALVEALLSLVVRTNAVHPRWAQSAAAGGLATVALVSLALGRLRAGDASGGRVRVLRWSALAVALAAGAIAIGAGVTAG